MNKVVLQIDGMTCSACSSGLEKYLKKQDGILDAEVNLVLSTATISYENLKIADLERFVQEAGFKSLGQFQQISEARVEKREKFAFILMTFLLILVVLISMGPMVLSFFQMNPIIKGLLLLILTICFFVYGKDLFLNGLKNLIHLMPNMDSLVLFSVGASFCYSIYAFFQVFFGNFDAVHFFSFESSCMVIYFVKLGRLLEKRELGKAKEAIQNLVQITPDYAVLKSGKGQKKVTLDEVKKGDILIASAGKRIAVDGQVVSGKAYVDEAFITGESLPVLKEMGSSLIAGSILYDGSLEYIAEKIGKDSTISEIVQLVVHATGSKGNIERLADKISGYFVPFVLILAVITFLFYFLTGSSFDFSLNIFVSILVVSCPCALGLAVPIASVISNSICLQKGIVVKEGTIFEKINRINTVIFDKTGTLTYGKPKISKFQNFSSFDDEKFLQIVASLEAKSNHPIASAFSKENLLPVQHFQNLEGIGIQGEVDGKKYFLGSHRILSKFSISKENLEEENDTTFYVVCNKQLLGMISVSDIVRKDVQNVITSLHKMGIEVYMVTGDHDSPSIRIAKELGISHVLSNVLPAQKNQIVQDFLQKGKFVMMIGDGINDAPALTSATIGVSIQDATDIAISSASVLLMNQDLSHILDFIQVGKQYQRTIRQNLFWAFFYNLCMIPIAMGVFLPFGIGMNPMFGSIAMVLSSFTVVLNSCRMLARKER